MFFWKKNKQEEQVTINDNDIVAIVGGDIYPTKNIKDSVFADELMGQTIVVKPEAKLASVVSPANGTVEVLYPTGHAFAIRMKNGVGLLVHIGIDTVELQGKGFKMLSKQGAVVKAGQAIVEVDFAMLEKEGYDTSVMLIVTENPDEIKYNFKQDQTVKVMESMLVD